MTRAAPDYIVVGAGAGGAVVAARLAESGFRVLVIEAGGDPLSGAVDESLDMPVSDAIRVPAFHAFASEHPGLCDDHWVKHHDDIQLRRRDWRYDPQRDGVLYPRAKGLGGCTAHHAMITVRPNDSDWNQIAAITGDPGWRASAMQRYFERIERCRYRPFFWRWLWRLTGFNPTGHGWSGWQTTERAIPLRAILDLPLRLALLRSVGSATDLQEEAGTRWETTTLDPNDRRWWNRGIAGIRVAPLGTRRHARHGARERLLDVHDRHPERLELRLHSKVLRVEIRNGRAIGVVVRKPSGGEELIETSREVILAGGAFGTPHLLMLSGVGDARHLRDNGIEPQQDLPGVGSNMQDRYEIGVVNRMKKPWGAMRGVTYSRKDRHYRVWKWFGRGNYASNGVLFSLAMRSDPRLAEVDLHCFALLADFRGYYRGYSERLRRGDYLSWVILKAYAANRNGSVRLTSADPDTPPDISCRSFSGPGDTQDLDAVVQAIRVVRRLGDSMDDLVAEEEEPGRQRSSDESLRDYVRQNAWGHHACGTAAMGPKAEGGVLDARLRVHGIGGLRVVDASAFPRIPGYFLAMAIFMLAERGADMLIEDADQK
ncbi:GMC family oxidoreductase [Paracoccus caeni]|uniref:GMC family oxidoreductase n=1 Tax=Paracoccus caeni TaxID=657651 RepID=A0A934VYR5_9RHOB|nr:GMC family oxidoreductase [Paracoccus caeni]MBK4215040.1 GMC family oxidoreductase [Paracoccus caeni]